VIFVYVNKDILRAMKELKDLLRVGVRGAIFGGLALAASVALAAFQAPPGAPTTCPTGTQGCDAPINTSATAQTKTGDLTISGTLTTSGALSVNGAQTDPTVGTIRDADGGWIRTYGATGWYNQTYGGGWNMSDTTYLRAFGDKYVYTGGKIRADAGFCIGGSCINSWAGNGGINIFGGLFNKNSQTGGCITANHFTGACSCPGWAPYTYVAAYIARYSMDDTAVYYCMSYSS
jgi:hypothetical protein